jgi:protein AroM
MPPFWESESKMLRFGLVTIGQSPRPDVLASMLPGDAHSRILELGALDGLSRDEIDQFQPRSSETPFVTRLADGSEVLVSKDRLMPRIQLAIDELVKSRVDAAAILCTGDFSEIRSPVPLVLPDRVLQATVDAIMPRGSIGVVMPHEGQMEMMRSRWRTSERTFVGVACSPYTSANDLEAIGAQLAAQCIDLIVLDCMGFTAEMKRCIASVTGKPVIQANRLVGRIVGELLGDA